MVGGSKPKAKGTVNGGPSSGSGKPSSTKQRSIASFFGASSGEVKPSSEAKPTQRSIASFFGGGSETKNTESPKPPKRVDGEPEGNRGAEGVGDPSASGSPRSPLQSRSKQAPSDKEGFRATGTGKADGAGDNKDGSREDTKGGDPRAGVGSGANCSTVGVCVNELDRVPKESASPEDHVVGDKQPSDKDDRDNGSVMLAAAAAAVVPESEREPVNNEGEGEDDSVVTKRVSARRRKRVVSIEGDAEEERGNIGDDENSACAQPGGDLMDITLDGDAGHQPGTDIEPATPVPRSSERLPTPEGSHSQKKRRRLRKVGDMKNATSDCDSALKKHAQSEDTSAHEDMGAQIINVDEDRACLVVEELHVQQAPDAHHPSPKPHAGADVRSFFLRGSGKGGEQGGVCNKVKEKASVAKGRTGKEGRDAGAVSPGKLASAGVVNDTGGVCNKVKEKASVVKGKIGKEGRDDGAVSPGKVACVGVVNDAENEGKAGGEKGDAKVKGKGKDGSQEGGKKGENKSGGKGSESELEEKQDVISDAEEGDMQGAGELKDAAMGSKVSSNRMQAVSGKGKQKKGAALGKPKLGVAASAPGNGSAESQDVIAATWKPGERVPYLFLAEALNRVSKESSRLAMAEIMCNVFRIVMQTTPDDLLPVVFLSVNKVAAPHEGLELGIGEATLTKALAEATGRKESQIKHECKETGDLGLVAQHSRTTQRTMFAPQPLTCVKVLEAFLFIAKETGPSSQDKKRGRIKSLLVSARDCEPQFIIRSLQGKMRIGLAEQTVLVALAQATVLEHKPPFPQSELSAKLEEGVKIIKKVHSELPCYNKIVPALLDVGIMKLPDVCHFTLGVPVGPMLAKPTNGVSEILDKFQDITFTSEYKYDGERAQIHCMEDGTIEIYSRNAERNTGKFPDIVSSMMKYAKPETKSYVIDCEAVGYDRETNRILPFQILSTRARKGVIMGDIKVQVCLFAFDILYYNGKPLLREQLKKRRDVLYNAFAEVKGEFQFASALDSRDIEEIQMFLQDAVNSSSEGLIVKTLETDATYEPAKRSNNWLKLKKDYMDNIGDSMDLVPIGAFYGKGKRTGVYGAFLLACYDDDAEEYQSICKIGTGFSEAILEERSSALKEKVIPKPRPYYRYGESLGADVWFEPCEVWEVKAADLSISPVHRAAVGHVDPSKGIALRFPRFLRVRTDKQTEEATTASQIAELYRSQANRQHESGAGRQDDDD